MTVAVKMKLSSWVLYILLPVSPFIVFFLVYKPAYNSGPSSVRFANLSATARPLEAGSSNWKENVKNPFKEDGIKVLLNDGGLSDKDTVSKALNMRSGMRGFHEKKGILDPVQWRPEFKEMRKKAALKWISNKSRPSDDDLAKQPPYQVPGCLVHINRDYKFIWIKGKKVGGTTIREPLGWICGDNWEAPPGRNIDHCSERLHVNLTITLEEIKENWKDYFVFGFARNPFARFASSYTYINSYGGKGSQFQFWEVCRDPFKQARAYLGSGREWNFDMDHHVHHMMEQSSCFFTENGEIAVDFVGETESLMDDLQTILDKINERKPDHLPLLEKPPSSHKKENANQNENYEIELFSQHSGCIGHIVENFWIDFHLLFYSLPSVTS